VTEGSERWWRLLWVACLVAALGGATWWGPGLLRGLDYFALRRVEVVGAVYLPPERVAGMLGLGERASVWEDVGALEERLRASAGLEQALVERRLPGTLRVTVREVEPVALAQGAQGLVALSPGGSPLPFDPRRVPVDAPVVRHPSRPLAVALAAVRSVDRGLFAAAQAARLWKGGLALELDGGRVLLDTPVVAEAVTRVAAVRRDLQARGGGWAELDGRFGAWVVARGGSGRGPVSGGAR
jgi:hypothetical protein